MSDPCRVTRGPGSDRHPALTDHLYSLELELPSKGPSRCHPPPPASPSTLTRCLLNRQQPTTSCCSVSASSSSTVRYYIGPEASAATSGIAPVFPWTDLGPRLERPGERAQVRIAKLHGNLGRREFRIPQQLLCQFKAGLADQAMEAGLLGPQALAQGSFVDAMREFYR